MRAVIDTNVLLSGLFWHGAPHVLLEQVRAGTLILVSSPALLAELEDVFGRAKFDSILRRSNTSREHVLAEMRQLPEMIEPPPLPQPVCRDSDDDGVIALALAAQADFIVSGDDDLLSLRRYQDIPILSPAEAVARVDGEAKG
ncbi:MAG: putative toxin-antitoxin system toxin component, PIN family [Sulfuritalea sp.]|nr:putative toxin-antitoxin system toxin component, PIN family [Sulfuritalea sp.]